MSVLLIAPYRQTDAWGNKSLQFAKLIEEQYRDKDLCIRPFYYNLANLRNDIGDLEKYEYNKVTSKDVLIQFALPMNLSYNGDFDKNIAVTMVDSNVKDLGWDVTLNLFDEIYVFSENEKVLLQDSSVTSKIAVINLAEENSDGYQDLGINLQYYKNSTCFYTDASPSESSGLRETVAAFLSNYHASADVSMFVFCEDHEKNQVKQAIDEVKEKLGIYSDDRNYRDIAIINSKAEPILNYAHANFDCYINVEYGGKINGYLSNALRLCKPSIMLDTFKGLNSDYPLLVESCDQICLLKERPMPGINSGRHSWKVPSSTDIARKMKLIDNEVVEKCKQYILSYNNTKG
jgi:hypothetical protein